MTTHRSRVALLAMVLALVSAWAAGPAAAGIWTEVPSGASSTITAIEYQSDARLWFTTANGEIWRRRADLGGFERVRNATGLALNDIEFQPGGLIGLAVGVGGTVVRSTDGGANWAAVPAAGIPVSNIGDGSGNKCTSTEPLGDVNFVRFAGPGRVWIGGPRRQLATSQPVDPANAGAIGTWYDANRKSVPVAGDNCYVEQSDGFADLFAAGPDVLYIAAAGSDAAILSPDDMRSETTTLGGEVANGLTTAGTMAGDPGSPNRQWGVSPAPYGNSTMQYTEDGWGTSRWVTLLDESAHPWPGVGPYDVAFNGGTVLAAGNGNFVVHSTNGRDFWWNGADGAGADWRAVALASATQGAIGGVGGRLMLTTQATALPIPPIAPPVVPPVVRPPRRGSGGSDTPPNVSGRPETHTTGGARLTLWKRIALSEGRFVPVRVSARSPRRFVVEIRRAARPRRRVAMAKARLRSGTKLVKVPLSRSVRTGRYRVVVRVFQGRRQIGRRVTVAFVLAR